MRVSRSARFAVVWVFVAALLASATARGWHAHAPRDAGAASASGHEHPHAEHTHDGHDHAHSPRHDPLGPGEGHDSCPVCLALLIPAGSGLDGPAPLTFATVCLGEHHPQRDADSVHLFALALFACGPPARA